jgi:hypothetical protein
MIMSPKIAIEKVLTVMCLVSFAAVVSAESEVAICKGDAIPPDRVIVKEYVSEQCKVEVVNGIQDPNVPNAYSIDQARDGLRVCEPRSPVGFFLCEQSEPSTECGGHKTYFLKSPAACAASAHRVGGLDVRIYCPDKPLPDGYVMVGTAHMSHFCTLPGNENGVIIRRISSPNLSLAMKGRSSTVRASSPVESDQLDLTANPAWKCRKSDKYPPQTVVTGRFETPSCPDVGLSSNLNAEVLDFLPATGTSNRYEICSGSPIPEHYARLMDVPVSPPVHVHNTGGKRRPTPRGDVKPATVHTFYKAECGGSKPNAILVYWFNAP